jgi:hypothetical protein
MVTTGQTLLEQRKARNNRLLGFMVGVILTSIVFYFIGGC